MAVTLLATLTLGAGLSSLHITAAAAAAHARTAIQTSQYPMTVKDDSGRTIVIKEKPIHIVSLTLGTDEVLTAMLPGRDLAGIDYFSINPIYSHIVSLVKREHLPVIGSGSGSINAEEIIAARPDLVLTADYTNPKVVKQLQNLGIPVYEFSSFNSFSDILSHILTLGKLVDASAKAKAIVAHIDAQMAVLHATQPKHKLSVLYYTWGSVAGVHTTANDVILAAGGKNAAAQISGWATVSAEQVVKLNPDVIVVPDDSGAKDAELKSFLAIAAFKHLRAVKEHHVYTASDGDLSDVGQYFPRGVKDMQHLLDLALSK